MNTVKTLDLPAGPAMPVLGLGTWRLGEDPARRPAEVAAVRAALRMGYRLIDTAEMYGDGGSEEVVGQAIAEAIAAGEVRRDALYVVSKVLPHNASRRGTSSACARSLARLGLERLDLYLLHWRGPHRLADTVAALEALVAEGRIGAWGVSNFDTDDMDELAGLSGGSACAANQVLYNLTRRGVELDLLPWCRQRRVPVMAYSPIEQGRLLRHPGLAAVAARHRASAAQVALAWLLRQDGTIVIPKAVHPEHVRENRAAAGLVLSPADLAELDRAFPRPSRRRPLEML